MTNNNDMPEKIWAWAFERGEEESVDYQWRPYAFTGPELKYTPYLKASTVTPVIEGLETEVRHLKDDYKMSQQQCRHQAAEISQLKQELAKRSMDIAMMRRSLKDTKSALGIIRSPANWEDVGEDLLKWSGEKCFVEIADAAIAEADKFLGSDVADSNEANKLLGE